jgi:hypothetical protein
MTDIEKLTFGKKPYFISSSDGAVTTKKFFLIIPCDAARFTALESDTGNGVKNEKVLMNILDKTIPALTTINCEGKSYFTKVHVSHGLVAAYEVP